MEKELKAKLDYWLGYNKNFGYCYQSGDYLRAVLEHYHVSKLYDNVTFMGYVYCTCCDDTYFNIVTGNVTNIEQSVPFYFTVSLKFIKTWSIKELGTELETAAEQQYHLFKTGNLL